MSISLPLVDPFLLDRVGVDSALAVRFVSYDHEGDVGVVGRLLERFLPPGQPVVRIAP